ncbi:hypothetical protein AMAG_13643 [Allomyces macrogynus ATCC 38327]|uniref:AP complex subunit sigma n=1 Tax=Allomyces macrogynus (strain ATCC 38327) TaxID=578462 RepID=A0A0L0T1W7_ALLM3|nr:hypothetical protein GGF32_005819 [Allomyces javanicus]KNE68746.1 hypothetical protein AMAG_13389 [Allomyces macrogynus ATCC 38327]KNE69259.1 hypothetical protein AMAG_13643 [Allomyces macrogynus ATCC 38327]|eukprot:KNE68746.1 hypothetical protein AMAG_13389 [Allomyces macrogynus ATCC 38327]
MPIRAFLLFSRHGKIRLKKFFATQSTTDRAKLTTDVMTTVLARKHGMCNVVEYKGDRKLIYKRYASLYFCAVCDWTDNELLTLEVIHRYVQSLDQYFGNVCELDIVFHFQSAYQILDELIIGGEQVESSAKETAKVIKKIDELEAESSGVPSLLQQIVA